MSYLVSLLFGANLTQFEGKSDTLVTVPPVARVGGEVQQDLGGIHVSTETGGSTAAVPPQNCQA